LDFLKDEYQKDIVIFVSEFFFDRQLRKKNFSNYLSIV